MVALLFACLQAPVPSALEGGWADLDGDGFSPDEGDCDDTQPSIFPGAAELCDGLDNDCNPSTLEAEGPEARTWPKDGDGDGYAGSDVERGCEPPPSLPDEGDCDDSASGIHPGAAESCDGVDQDCDGQVDEGLEAAWYSDGDGDGYGAGEPVLACEAPSGHVSVDGDCDDEAFDTSPDGVETCGNGVDEDCLFTADCRLQGVVSVDSLVSFDFNVGGHYPSTGIGLGGDPDGDGVGSAVIFNTHQNDNAGRLSLFHGPITADAGAGWLQGDHRLPDLALAGYPPDHELPTAVASGDLTGDGVADLAVACHDCDSGHGRIYLLAGDYPESVYTTDLPYVSTTDWDHLGRSVAVGDVTGDGLADLIGGAWTEDDGAAGEVHVVPGPLIEDSIDEGVVLSGKRSYDLAGTTVGVLDLDGDGVADIAVGSPGDSGRRDRGGQVTVIYGPITSDASLKDADAVLGGADPGSQLGSKLQLADLDGDGHGDLAAVDTEARRVLVVQGPIGYGELVVSDSVDGGSHQNLTLAAGDLDGDEAEELAVASPQDRTYSPNGGEAGSVYLFHGGWSGGVELADADAVVHGARDDDSIGRTLAMGDDLTGDGVGDLLIFGVGDVSAWLLPGTGE